jgi:hypothetical protein
LLSRLGFKLFQNCSKRILSKISESENRGSQLVHKPFKESMVSMKELALDSRLYGWLFDICSKIENRGYEYVLSGLGHYFVRTTVMRLKNHRDNRLHCFLPF